MKIYTIGFTKKSARDFFGLLRQSGGSALVDVRLNNVSQLAGFAKRDDLAYFVKELCGMTYRHEPILAPTKEMLDEYKKNRGSWETYEMRFLRLLQARNVETVVPRSTLDNAVLLCSEEKPHHCHRRLVAEYMREHWGSAEIHHLG